MIGAGGRGWLSGIELMGEDGRMADDAMSLIVRS